LQLDSIRRAHESRKRGNLIKLAFNCISSTLEKCAKKIAIKIQSNFKNNTKGIYHKSDQIALESVEISVNKTDYFQVNFGPENKANNSYQLQSVVKAVDQGQIFRDSYQNLAAAEINLSHEHSVSIERINITNYINQLIKISLVNMNKQNELNEIIEKPDIINAEIIQKVIDTAGVGIYRNAKDILYYIIFQLKKQKVLKSSDLTIYLHVFGA
jgi:hypothetical protein